METDAPIFPESAASDESEPPPGFSLSKSDLSEGPASKPTFKNALQAKKRLQAYSSTRTGALSASPVPKKPKCEEKLAAKKPNCHEDKAKTVIEEIEELKREEQACLDQHRHAAKKSRSRSTDKGRFKKVSKRERNYRRRSSTDDKPKKVQKKSPSVQKKPAPKKSPRNWREFSELEASFGVNCEAATSGGHNNLLRQMCFEGPSLPITPFKMKSTNREDKIVPFEFIRYTKAKPTIPFSINCGAIKQVFLPRKMILDSLPKHIVANIEKLHSNSFKFKTGSDAKSSNSRSWYPKVWKDADNECKILEKSVGLSFLQTYAGEEEEAELAQDEDKKVMTANNVDASKKLEEEGADEKKRKKKRPSSVTESTKKRKDKGKNKKKKEKKSRGKLKNKKSKEKKKKEKTPQVEEKSEKPSKQQVIEELKLVEEKLAKKRELDKQKEKQEEKGRKRKHSEREECNAKRANTGKPKKVDAEKKSEKDKKAKTEEDKKKSESSEGVTQVDQGNEETNQAVEKDTTPDTDDYHSHWESDDDVSSSVPRPVQSLKVNRSWESDEELFGRSNNTSKTQTETYTNLEIPLNIKTFVRRESLHEKAAPLAYIEEFKLLEEERRTLSEERRKLELEKQRILKLKEQSEEKKPVEDARPANGETPVKIKKEKIDGADFNFDSLSSSLLSNVSSSESNFPIAVLENQYEEFMKAVSSEPIVSKKKSSSSSSWSSSSSSSDSDHKKKKRRAKMKKKRKKKKRGETGKSNIFDEFDIPVPSDLPEMIPPLPVPSPLEIPLVPKPNLLLDVLVETKADPVLDLKRPFVFSSIVLPKKAALVDNSGLNLNDDSDSNDFTEKFVVKKPEASAEDEQSKPEESEAEKLAKEAEPVVEKAIEAKVQVEEVVVTVAPPPKTAPVVVENKPMPRSVSPPRRPPERPRDKRRSRSRSPKRRSPIRRRELTPLSRRRRRTPPRRRLSPRRRSLSPRRRTPPRRRRRSPSMSPPRSWGLRKRTPSPRNRRSSPLNSPLDGFKRSVADSTISDDMLPQMNPDDYMESPQPYAKAYRGIRRSTSPTNSPKRISLDERINMVLGVEKNEQLAPKPLDSAYNYGYNPYVQYPQYNQYSQFGPMMYAQPPPPPIAKPVPTPTKVVQVGNILQVVPTEEIPPCLIEPKPVECSQKIVQVGNMLQIVPGVMPCTIPPVLESPQQVQSPEKVSAEVLMKQKIAERKAEKEKRRQERDRRRKEKERKRKEKEKRKQLKIKQKTENMIKRAIQIEAEALANDDVEDEAENDEVPVQWPPISVVVAATPSCKGILVEGGSGSKKRKTVQFADGVRPGEGTSPSGGEELSSPPLQPPKLPKEKRYKKLKIPKKSVKKKIKVKVIKRVQQLEEEDDDEDDDNLPPPSPPPGSPPSHIFPSRVKTPTINNVHQYVGNLMQSSPAGFPFRPPMGMVVNRHQQAPAYLAGNYHSDVNSIAAHQSYQGVSSHH